MRDKWILKGTGQVIVNVHREDECLGYWCTIHNPMPGPWSEWPMTFGFRGMERICEHGYLHTAPEDVLLGVSWGIHECDGCPCMPTREDLKRIWEESNG